MFTRQALSPLNHLPSPGTAPNKMKSWIRFCTRHTHALSINDTVPVTLNIFSPFMANDYMHLKFLCCLPIPHPLCGGGSPAWQTRAIPSTPLFSLNSCLIVWSWLPGFALGGGEKKDLLVLSRLVWGWKWVCLRGAPLPELRSGSPISLLPLLGVSCPPGDRPGFLSQAGSGVDRAGRCSCQRSTTALLCSVLMLS